MNELKVLFVGVGSIAKRHIRNLHAIGEKIGLAISIDAFRRRSSTAPIDGIKNEFTKISDVPCDYDIVFITNPTDQHLETLKLFHNKGKNFFIEKPVVSLSQLEEAKAFKLRSDCIYHVACPLRYNAVIQYIKAHVPVDEVISIRCISSSYLPDWRPDQDYRKTYSAHKDMGGGVSIDLIHEWDYLTYLFGWPEKVYSLIGKKSSLEIDSDDYAVYIAEYADKILELHLDYFGQRTIREIELFTKEDTILGDIVSNKITFLKSGKELDFKEERDDYQKRELLNYIDLIFGDKGRLEENGVTHGLRLLSLSQGLT